MQTTSPYEHSRGAWYAAQVRVGRERVCAAHLDARGYEVCLPYHREAHQWSDRLRTVTRALFPGYVFCRASQEAFGKVVTTPGVVRLVGNGNRPVPVPPEEIEPLQQLVANGLTARPWALLTVGRQVRLVRGPLQGVTGTIIDVSGTHRIVVAITLLQRAIAIDIDPSWLLLDDRDN